MMELSRRLKEDRGAAAVEFALLVPLLLLLLFGIVDFARAFNAQITVTHAAREGVRVHALGGTSTETTDAAEGAATPRAVTVSATTCDQGNPTSVTVSTDFEYVTPISPIMQLFGGSGILPTTLNGTGVMRCGG